MIEKVLRFAAPRKGTNIIRGCSPWAISNMQHHEFRIAAGIASLCGLVTVKNVSMAKLDLVFFNVGTYCKLNTLTALDMLMRVPLVLANEMHHSP